MKNIIVLILFLITSCGYQPLYKVEKRLNYEFINEVEFLGNKKISKQIFSKLPYKINSSDKKLNKIIFDSKINTIETSKDSKGKVTSYRTSLTVNYSLLDQKNNTLDNKLFSKEFSYNSDENKFKFKDYQKKVEKNLIDGIIKNIIIHLNL